MSPIVQHLASLAIAIDGEHLPSEFRIFKAGVNTTEQGPYLFDDRAAKAVIAAYTAHEVDRMIDLEHLSLFTDAPNFDPDARGWCKLEVRPGPELWAVNVTWTEDGSRRLREKTQRYVSPFFAHTKSGQITKIINIALTALPATHGTEELVAARHSLRKCGAIAVTNRTALLSANGEPMDANLIKEALDAIEGGDSAKALEILKGLIASAAGAPPEDPPADPNAEPAAATVTEDNATVVAATTRLARITGKDTIGAAVEEVETWRVSHLALDAERAKLTLERQTLESSERRKLVGDLVKLGIEIPATAWSDDQGTTPTKRLQDEPLAELRTRVAKLTAARGGTPPPPPTPPPPGSEGTTGLSTRELEMCREKKIDPAKYAETRAKIRDRSPHAGRADQ